MRTIFLLLSLLLSLSSFSQTKSNFAAVDTRMDKMSAENSTSATALASFISSNFTAESEKMRALFYWTVSNISYDVPKMLAPNLNESTQDKIDNTLKTKKGVCMHYAEVFNAVSNKLGIKCYVIEGFTKQNGKVANVSHAWCAAKIDNKWFLFDPTWGSGYVNNGKFFKKINNSYFMVNPTELIATHMPFDYMWQFINYPFTNREFLEAKKPSTAGKVKYDFGGEIKRYDSLSDSDKAFESSERIEKNGLVNALVIDQYKYKKEAFRIYTQNKNIEKLNALYSSFNENIFFLNDFMMYRFKKFKPTQSDEEMKQWIQNVKNKFKQCETDVYNIGIVGTENTGGLSNLKKAIATALMQTEEQEQFLTEYLSKNSIGRKLMLSNLKIRN
jgi:hypothetical protein